jgi:hypothetical protein
MSTEMQEKQFGPLGREIAVLIGNRRLVGRTINRPFTLVAVEYKRLVTIDRGVDWRCGKPVLCGRCRISLTGLESDFEWPVDVAVIDGADVLVGTDLVQSSITRPARRSEVRSSGSGYPVGTPASASVIQLNRYRAGER